jgi:LAGLIDADG DNA endonuclease family
MIIPDILPTTVGLGRMSKIVSDMIYFTPFIKEVIVGLLLSDASIQRRKPTWNARLGFTQSLSHFSYFWHVFSILSHYCSSVPYLTSSLGRFPGLGFYTRAFPCFTELHTLFYIEGVKVIPAIIFDLLTPVALAHWIMGDGSYKQGGLIICTDSFSIPDVVLLINVLIVKYQLECSLQMYDGLPRIYIKRSSMPLLRTIVLRHMQNSMLYKLGIK